MIIIRNLQELNNQRKTFNKAIYNMVELDTNIISNSFDNQSEDYGPAILIIDENEQEDIYQRYPILSSVEPEIEELIYKDEIEEIYRICYILTDSGFIVYVRKERKNV